MPGCGVRVAGCVVGVYEGIGRVVQLAIKN